MPLHSPTLSIYYILCPDKWAYGWLPVAREPTTGMAGNLSRFLRIMQNCSGISHLQKGPKPMSLQCYVWIKKTK
jgi:hypothetical protein